MQRQALLAVHDLAVLETAIPKQRYALQHRCHRRYGLELGVLEGIGELVFVVGIAAHADANGVKHRLPIRIAEAVAGPFQRH